MHRYGFIQHDRPIVGKYDEVAALTVRGLPFAERAIPDRIVDFPWLIEISDRTAYYYRKVEPRLIREICCNVARYDHHTVFAPVAQVLRPRIRGRFKESY